MALTSKDILSIVILVLATLFVFWFLANEFGAKTRIKRRLETAAKSLETDISVSGSLSTRMRLIRAMSSLGRLAPIFNNSQRMEMRAKLTAAGYRQSVALTVLMGSAIATGIVFALFVVLIAWPLMDGVNAGLRIILLVAAFYVGTLVPRIVLDRLVLRRQLAIANSFPDALDLMVVCANAGLGMTATIQRVAQELEFLAPELSDEFNLTSAQLQVSGDVSQVLTDMAERINMDSVRSLASTLNQSRQYGTPISDALRVLAASERTARRMRTEEAAGKLATKITLPMMVFILPTVLLIIGGPAMMGLMQSFSKMTN